MAECPTCGKELETERGVKSHRVQTHDEDVSEGRQTVTLVCNRCEDTYEKRSDRADSSRFCSAECQRKGRSTRGKEREERCCDQCDDTFTTHPNSDRRFCSTDCFYEWNAEHMSGDDSPLAVDYVEVVCSECGESLKRPPSLVRNSEQQYCSRECYHENYTGEDAPRWRGGHDISYYGENWISQRLSTLKRDGFECQDCGMTRDEHYNQYDTDLEVHHKTPIRTFEDTQIANQLSNLITLCTSCHSQREASTELKV